MKVVGSPAATQHRRGRLSVSTRFMDFRLAVLNPEGRDPEQHFRDSAGAPNEAEHAPVNHHGFAACTSGSFYRDATAIPAASEHVLLLLRGNFKAARQAIVELRASGKTIAIAFKEAGAFQVALQLSSPRKLRLFHEICERADGAIATTPDLIPLYRAAGVRYAELVPAPYPVEHPSWDFTRAPAERRGIFIGTREFSTLSRNHLTALLTVRFLAETMQEPVTVMNGDGWRGRRMLRHLRYPEGLLRVVEGKLPYPRYLRGVAKHKIIFQLDASAVPGQVAGDALLARIPCVGGNGTTERLVFPDLCGHGRTHEQLLDIAARLLEHPHDCLTVTERALELAHQRLSFTRVAADLTEFFQRISR